MGALVIIFAPLFAITAPFGVIAKIFEAGFTASVKLFDLWSNFFC